MKREDIEEMHNMRWYHKIDLGEGVVTPGREYDNLWTPLRIQMRTVDFSNKKVIDIGCWDGLFSFEAEKVGAKEVWATDVMRQRPYSEQGKRTFEFAKKHLKSKVKFREVSVYDLEARFKEEFDVVLFFGLLYHLRCPALALARIRNVLKTGGRLLMETAILLDTSATIIETDYRKIYPTDISTWNAFSEGALLSLLDESYLRPEEFKVILRQDEERKIGSGFVKARAFSGKHAHHYFPDEFLERHFASQK